MKLLVPLLLTFTLFSCSENRRTMDEIDSVENARPTVYDSANDLIGTEWVVDVFFNSNGIEYRSEDQSEWFVTFIEQTDFGAEAIMMIQYPCTEHSIPFTLTDGLFTVVTGLGSHTPDSTSICIEPNEAIIEIDIAFSKGKEYSYQNVDEHSVQISSIENDVLVIRLK